jgi:hypothetical protein
MGFKRSQNKSENIAKLTSSNPKSNNSVSLCSSTQGYTKLLLSFSLSVIWIEFSALRYLDKYNCVLVAQSLHGSFNNDGQILILFFQRINFHPIRKLDPQFSQKKRIFGFTKHFQKLVYVWHANTWYDFSLSLGELEQGCRTAELEARE